MKWNFTFLWMLNLTIFSHEMNGIWCTLLVFVPDNVFQRFVSIIHNLLNFYFTAKYTVVPINNIEVALQIQEENLFDFTSFFKSVVKPLYSSIWASFCLIMYSKFVFFSCTRSYIIIRIVSFCSNFWIFWFKSFTSNLHSSYRIKSFAASLKVWEGRQIFVVSVFIVAKGRVVAVCEKVFKIDNIIKSINKLRNKSFKKFFF